NPEPAVNYSSMIKTAPNKYPALHLASYPIKAVYASRHYLQSKSRLAIGFLPGSA
ncbi:MAG: hypothetical protein ACI822_003022, partial [Gammaproteobacteria bacterium]